MKKILVCLIAIVVVMNLSAQVEGTIQWRPEIDFTYQVNGEYVEISSETVSNIFIRELRSSSDIFFVASAILFENSRISKSIPSLSFIF